MRNKILGLLCLSMFVLSLTVGIVSAAVNFVNVTNNVSSVAQGDSVAVSFALQEDGAGNFTNMSFNTPITLTSGLNSFNSPSTVSGAVTSLTQSATSGTMSLTLSVSSTQAVGTYTGTLTISGDYTNSSSTDLPITITVTQNPLTCSIGNPGELKIKNIDFNSNGISDTTFGDDNAWFPLEEIEVEIEVENNGDDDVDNIEVEWGLYDTQNDEWVIELEDEKDFDLKDGKDEILNIVFTFNEKRLDVDFKDLDDGEHYEFYVQATGEVDNVNNDDTCASKTEDIEIVIESDFVVLDDIEFTSPVSCGSDFQVSADVWNIGDDDQDDVLVLIKNAELGISEKVEVGDIDAFEDERLDVTLTIPADSKEKIHNLLFQVYDEDNDLYQTDFDDDDSEFVFPLSVSGGCGVDSVTTTSGKVLVSAALKSGGKAGEELVIKATVTNTGDSLTTYSLNAAGYADWASLEEISQKTLVIASGDSATTLFTFQVKEDVSGDRTFNIEVLSGNELIATQPVSVSIEESGGFKFPGITGKAISGSNWYLWGIGLLNIILVVIIIIVAIRVARR